MLVYSRTLSEQGLYLFNVFRILTMNYLLVLSDFFLFFSFSLLLFFPALRPEEEKKEKEKRKTEEKNSKICLISRSNRHERIQGDWFQYKQIKPRHFPTLRGRTITKQRLQTTWTYRLIRVIRAICPPLRTWLNRAGWSSQPAVSPSIISQSGSNYFDVSPCTTFTTCTQHGPVGAWSQLPCTLPHQHST